MTREEAIKMLMDGELNPCVAEDREACDMAIKALEQEQTRMVDKSDFSQEQYLTDIQSAYDCGKHANRWIPVSERLPKDRREVLVTAYWHETYQVMMASYFGDGLWWCVPFNNCGEHMQRLKPKAWMPLPEPYKAESEE